MGQKIWAAGGGATSGIIGEKLALINMDSFSNVHEFTMNLLTVTISWHKIIEVFIYGAIGAMGGLVIRELYRILNRKIEKIYIKYCKKE